MGLFSSLKKAAGFELFHGKSILKDILHNPKQLIFGIDPIGTKIGNTAFGDNAKPIVNQLGGAVSRRYGEYGKDPGLAPVLQQVAGTIAGSVAGGALGIGGWGSAAVGAGASLADSKFGGSGPLPALDGRDGEVSDTAAPGSNFSWNNPNRPLRRFERTPQTVLTDMRNGDDPMKITKVTGVNARAVPVAGPQSIPSPAKPATSPVSSAPKTPPAVNYARQGLADVRRGNPRTPARQYSK